MVTDTSTTIRKQLGLTKLKNVYISLVYKTTPRVYLVFFNSQSPYIVMNRQWLKSHMKTDIFRDGKELAQFSPPLDINQFGGNLRGAIFVTVDLAGDNLHPKYTEAVSKLKSGVHYSEVSVYDLKDKGNISDFTKVWFDDANRLVGTGNRKIKFIDCFLNSTDDTATFAFQSTATQLKGKKPNPAIDSDYKYYKPPKQRVHPLTLDLLGNKEETYEIQLQITKLSAWLDVFEGEEITRAKLKSILQVSDVKLFCSSPAFQYQGFNFWLSSLEASIYPEDREPKVWNKVHGDGQAFLDKHTYSLVNYIDFFLNPMSSMLTKKLKDHNLI